MPARKTRQVRYITNENAQPPRNLEVITASEHALAFQLGGYHWDPDRPDQGDGAGLSGTWAVLRHVAERDIAYVTYDRAERLAFETGGQRYRQLYEAMEAAEPEPGADADRDGMAGDHFAAELGSVLAGVEAIGMLGSREQRLIMAQRLFRQLGQIADAELGLVDLERD